MANQITDNRTVVYAFDSTTSTDDLAGAAAGSLDSPPEVFIQNGASIGEVITNAVNGILFDAGSAQDWSNNVFYIWINCGIVGLLKTKTNAGFTIRFCGNTVTDWFEVYVGGSDSWPNAVEGGWTQFVVDIEDARAAAIVGTVGGTNGTTPATSAVRYVGWSGITATVMTKMVDNTWIDEIRRLPDGSPGIIIEGRNGGSTDWTSADILTELGVATGTFLQTTGGAYKLNTPIQFGINDTTTHAFTDTNQIWLWDDQEFAPTDLYKLSALGNSGGTTDVELGAKTGTGDDATGSQGVVIAAAAAGVRWDMDFNDPDLDSVNLYGCNFIHGGAFLLDDPAVSIISSLYLDCNSTLVSNSEQLRNSIVNANTADGVAFMTTDDLTDVVFCNFEFSDGHGVELTTPIVSTQISKGNIYINYGITTSNDAAVYNNTAGAVTINVTDDGDSPTYRNGTSASTTVNNTVTLTVTVTDSLGAPIDSARVRIQEPEASGGTQIAQGSTNGSGVFTDSTFNFTSDQAIEIIVRKSTSGTRYVPFSASGTITSTGFSLSVTMQEDAIAV